MSRKTLDAPQRIANALERIADSFDESARITTLESLLRELVDTMEDAQSSDQDWQDLLASTKEALEIK